LTLGAFVAVAMQALPAAASFPKLSLILPRGVQRGGDRELTFTGARLGDAEEILFHSADGLAVKSLTPVDANSFKAVVHVPEGCPLGEQIVHVRAKSGITEYRSFWVGALPIADEVEPNGSLEQAQAVPLNTTVHGIADTEDLDCFAVELKQGQRLSVEAEGLRVQVDVVERRRVRHRERPRRRAASRGRRRQQRRADRLDQQLQAERRGVRRLHVEGEHREAVAEQALTLDLHRRAEHGGIRDADRGHQRAGARRADAVRAGRRCVVQSDQRDVVDLPAAGRSSNHSW
jgi:hypothetical protein